MRPLSLSGLSKLVPLILMVCDLTLSRGSGKGSIYTDALQLVNAPQGDYRSHGDLLCSAAATR